MIWCGCLLLQTAASHLTVTGSIINSEFAQQQVQAIKLLLQTGIGVPLCDPSLYNDFKQVYQKPYMAVAFLLDLCEPKQPDFIPARLSLSLSRASLRTSVDYLYEEKDPSPHQQFALEIISLLGQEFGIIPSQTWAAKIVMDASRPLPNFEHWLSSSHRKKEELTRLSKFQRNDIPSSRVSKRKSRGTELDASSSQPAQKYAKTQCSDNSVDVSDESLKSNIAHEIYGSVLTPSLKLRNVPSLSLSSMTGPSVFANCDHLIHNVHPSLRPLGTTPLNNVNLGAEQMTPSVSPTSPWNMDTSVDDSLGVSQQVVQEKLLENINQGTNHARRFSLKAVPSKGLPYCLPSNYFTMRALYESAFIIAGCILHSCQPTSPFVTSLTIEQSRSQLLDSLNYLYNKQAPSKTEKRIMNIIALSARAQGRNSPKEWAVHQLVDILRPEESPDDMLQEIQSSMRGFLSSMFNHHVVTPTKTLTFVNTKFTPTNIPLETTLQTKVSSGGQLPQDKTGLEQQKPRKFVWVSQNKYPQNKRENGIVWEEPWKPTKQDGN